MLYIWNTYKTPTGHQRYNRGTGQRRTGKTRHKHLQNTQNCKQIHSSANNIYQSPPKQPQPNCWCTPWRFLDGPFPVHSGEGTTHRQMLHNHISINCTNPVVSLRCGENHHYKTYTKGKREAVVQVNTPLPPRPVQSTSHTWPHQPKHQPARFSAGKATITNPPSLHHNYGTEPSHLCDDLKQKEKQPAMDDKKIEEALNHSHKGQ